MVSVRQRMILQAVLPHVLVWQPLARKGVTRGRVTPLRRFTVAPLIALATLLWQAPTTVAGIVNNSGSSPEDSLNVNFQLLDSLGNPVQRASGDSLWLFVWYPGGGLAFTDSARILSDANVTQRQLQAGAKAMAFLSYKRAIADVDGAGNEGVYKYTLVAYDSSLALATPVIGEFQLYATNNFSDYLDARPDSAVVARVVGRKGWGIAAGTAGSGDSSSVTQRNVDLNLWQDVQPRGLAGGSVDLIPVNVEEVTDNAIKKADIENNFLDSTKLAANTIGSSEISPTAAAEFKDSVWSADTSNTLWNGALGRFGEWNASAQAGAGAAITSAQMGQIADSVWTKDTSNALWNGQLNRFGEWNAAAQAQIGGAGSGSQADSIFLLDTSGTDTKIPGVTVSIQNEGGTLNLGTLVTNANGLAVFNLSPSSSYRASANLVGYVFPLYPFTTSAAATYKDTVRGYNFDPGIPASASLCRVYGWVYDLSQNRLGDATVRARITESPLRYQNVVISPYERTTTTDTAGHWFLDLYPSSSLTPSTTVYEFEIRHPSGAVLRRKLAVPVAAQWLLTW